MADVYGCDPRDHKAVDLVADLSRQSEKWEGSHDEFQVGFVLDRGRMSDVLSCSVQSSCM